jgi:hypothetical protein
MCRSVRERPDARHPVAETLRSVVSGRHLDELGQEVSHQRRGTISRHPGDDTRPVARRVVPNFVVAHRGRDLGARPSVGRVWRF